MSLYPGRISSKIEENSGAIEADRGGIEVDDDALMKGKLLYRKNDGAQTEQNQPSASVTTSREDAAGSSENKDTNITSNDNENNESLTFEDGTPIPVDESEETDLSQTDGVKNGKSYYDNYLTYIEKGNLIDYLNQSDSQDEGFKPTEGAPNTSYALSVCKDTKLLETLQINPQENNEK